MTGSAGVSYRWHDILFTSNLISGSGLRAGDLSQGVAPNSLHTTPYAVINVGVAHDFKWSPTPNRSPSGSISSICSTKFTSCATAPALGSLPRNTGRGAASSRVFRKSCDDGPLA